MVGPQYLFTSDWKLTCPLYDAWNTIYDVHTWKEWWPAIHEVRSIEPGDRNDIGRKEFMQWKAPLFYKLSFTVELLEKRSPFLIIANATGELEGKGVWKFFHQDGITQIIHEWNVSTTKKWMNDLAFILRPAFHWSHDAVMKSGAKGLAKRLNAELINY